MYAYSCPFYITLNDQPIHELQDLSTEKADENSPDESAILLVKGPLNRRKDDVAGLQSQIKTWKDDKTGLQPQVGALKDDIAGLQSQINTWKDDMTGFQPQIGALKDDVAGLQSQINTWKDDKTGLQSQIDGLNEKIKDKEENRCGDDGKTVDESMTAES